MPGKPDLEIDIAMNGAEALAMLKKIQDSMNKVGKEGNKAGKDTKDSFGGLNKIGDDIVGMATRFASVGAAVGAVNTLWSAYADGVSRSANEMARMSKEFTDFRKSLNEQAGMEGKAVTDQYTSEQIDRAKRLKVAPEILQKTVSEVNATIAGNISKNDKDGLQVTQAQANTITDKATQLGVARGISPGAMATGMGALVREAKPGASADQNILKSLGGQIAVGDMLPGHIETALPQANEISSVGAGARESMLLTGAMSSTGAVGEAGTMGRALIAGVSQFLSDVNDGKQQNVFGISDKDTSITAGRKIHAKAVKDGLDFKSPIAVDQWLKKYKLNGRMETKAFGNMFNAINTGQLSNMEKVYDKADAASVDSQIKNYQGGDLGQHEIAKADLQISEMRQGKKLSGFELAKLKAGKSLTDAGAFTHSTFMDSVQDALMLDSYFGDRRTFLTNKLAITGLHRKAVRLGATEDELPYKSSEIGGIAPNLGSANTIADQYLKVIAEKTAEQAAHAKVQADAAKKAANPPGGFEPPNPRMRPN